MLSPFAVFASLWIGLGLLQLDSAFTIAPAAAAAAALCTAVFSLIKRKRAFVEALEELDLATLQHSAASPLIDEVSRQLLVAHLNWRYPDWRSQFESEMEIDPIIRSAVERHCSGPGFMDLGVRLTIGNMVFVLAMGGLYLTGLIDDVAARIAVMSIWIIATSVQLLVLQGEEAEALRGTPARSPDGSDG
jgi:hypothetical protein